MTEFVGLPELPSGSRDEQTAPATAALTTEQHLARFYVELQAWIDGGCGDHKVFDPIDGICSAASGWAGDREIDGGALLSAIGNSFEVAGLSRMYPFNHGFADWFNEEDCYTNPARLAWIKARALGSEGA
jgi:hypothetical protein